MNSTVTVNAEGFDFKKSNLITPTSSTIDMSPGDITFTATASSRFVGSMTAQALVSIPQTIPGVNEYLSTLDIYGSDSGTTTDVEGLTAYGVNTTIHGGDGGNTFYVSDQTFSSGTLTLDGGAGATRSMRTRLAAVSRSSGRPGPTS